MASMNDTTLVGCLPLQIQPCSQSNENNVLPLFPEHPIFHSNNILNMKIHSDKIKVNLVNPLAVFIARKFVMSLKVNVIFEF